MKTSTKNFSLPFAADTILFCNETKERLPCKTFVKKAEREFQALGVVCYLSMLPGRQASIQHSLDKLEYTAFEISTFKEWIENQYEPDELHHLAKYGASGGVRGLAHNHQTSELYDKYQDEIWESIFNEFNDFNEFIASSVEEGAIVDAITFKCTLVWHAAEVLAKELFKEWERR